MSFASLAQPAVQPLIERFAAAPDVTLVVGAGASMEAGLPSWPELVERLLGRVAQQHPALKRKADREDWIRRTLERDELLGAGAVVEVMANEELDELLPEALYGDAGPAGYEPGPIAHQVAQLRWRFGDRITVLTTNYDDLIEHALLAAGATKAQVRAYVRRRAEPARGAIPVTHLHGHAGREGGPRKLVLTEEQYHRMQRGRSWQEEYVTDRLENSLCLFVGTSLTDPNLIRYLYGYRASSRRHAAVFVRQGDLEQATAAVREAREEAIGRRWRRCGVEPVFVDHYADAAQLLHEIGYRRSRPADYAPLGARAERALGAIERGLFAADGGADRFAEQQIALSRWLRELLYDLLETVLDGRPPPAGERLALALWLLGPDGATLTGWAHSDRAHQDPATIEAVPIAARSEWVAVRTICQGVRVDLDRHSAVSRLALRARAAARARAAHAAADRLPDDLLHQARGDQRAQPPVRQAQGRAAPRLDPGDRGRDPAAAGWVRGSGPGATVGCDGSQARRDRQATGRWLGPCLGRQRGRAGDSEGSRQGRRPARQGAPRAAARQRAFACDSAPPGRVSRRAAVSRRPSGHGDSPADARAVDGRGSATARDGKEPKRRDG